MIKMKEKCLVTLFISLAGCLANIPRMQPYFFMCNYLGNSNTLGVDSGEVSVSVHIDGNPSFYVPDHFYKVTITTSMNFDGFYVTGLYTMNSGDSRDGPQPMLQTQNLMCSIVYHQNMPLPQKSLEFFWRAPPSGTGCINFLGTASIGPQILFKDASIQELCEEDTISEPLRPDTLGVNLNNYIFRDSFDLSSDLSNELWSFYEGISVQNNRTCGQVMHHQSVMFCNKQDNRVLETVPLNLTSARVLQFATGPNTCALGSRSALSEPIIVSLGLNDCSNWTVIDTIRSLGSDTTVHLVHIPEDAQQSGVCVRWSQQKNKIQVGFITTPSPTLSNLDENTTTTLLDSGRVTERHVQYLPFESCWAMDNVLIVNAAHLPQVLHDSFDPVDPSNWLFFPGANIQQQCRSDKFTMYFQKENPNVNTFVSTRDLDLHTDDFSDALLEEDFETALQGWIMDGGQQSTTCREEVSQSAVFMNEGDRRLCTPFLDTSNVGNLRFYFQFGGNECNVSDSSKVHVLVYMEDNLGQTHVIQELYPQHYKQPRIVSLDIRSELRLKRARYCWLQKFHHGLSLDVWLVDSVKILPPLPIVSEVNKDKVIQFDLNLQCGDSSDDNEVTLEYSPDFGETWTSLLSPCLHGSCPGHHQPVSSAFSSQYDANKRWMRLTLPLPYAAMMPHTRFRWIQQDNNQQKWALDNVFIGSCPKGCNNHGECTTDGCRCDFGYTGPTCLQSIVPHPSLMMENFEDDSPLTASNIVNPTGATVSYDCGLLYSGKSLVFDEDGERSLITTAFNTTGNRYLQFFIRVGSKSPTSQCPPPDTEDESVLLDFSCDGGITWNLLKVYSHEDFSTPRSDMVLLPGTSKGPSCQFRWWQPKHDGYKLDMWALDGVGLNNHLFNTINIEVQASTNSTQPLIANLGRITDGYCDGRRSISFFEVKANGDIRILLTETIHVGPSYIMQFDLVMGCHHMYTEGIDSNLYLEFSADHGISWSPVLDQCLPPKSCNEDFTEGSVFKPSKYTSWTQVTIPLPQATWGPVTQFRFIQKEWGPTDSWGISRLYIGLQCPNMCHSHGKCVDGACVCHEGYGGIDCHSMLSLDTKMQADFGLRYEPDSDFLRTLGGEVTNGLKGCGILFSGESFYFSGSGVRQLETKDFDTRNADFVQFYLRIGGDLPDCSGSESRNEGVLLQFSNDGGATWILLQELVPSEYRTTKFVHKTLPATAKTASTRLRWWQSSHSGGGKDQWALDEIMIGSYEHMRSLHDNFNKHMEVLKSGMWSTVTEGITGKYCQARDPTLILTNQVNDKFVITKDMNLQTGDSLQFKINVGCSNQFRMDHPVMLQFSHDGGQTWRLVTEPCYQETVCDQLQEGSIYYSGPHGFWQTIVIPISEKIAMHPVQFRWWQHGGYAYSFALDDIYIGPPCPDHCNRNGLCVNNTCDCNPGFSGPTCRPLVSSDTGLIDWFDNRHEPMNGVWSRVVGGSLGLGCGVVDHGNSLYFDGNGYREAVTKPLNTTSLRVLQFVARIGSDGSHPTCSLPTSRNEGIVVDYSTDNEITWHVLKAVEPQIYNGSTESLTIDLPDEARTDYTIFRWWQALGHGGMPRAEWALDSVVVGVNRSNFPGFEDEFNSMMPNPNNWLLTESAVPRITCNSNGNALEFSRDTGVRFAITHDFHVTPSTFLQFDIAMVCDALYGTVYGTLYGVMLEYSVDMGQNWHPVVEECSPPEFECTGYHLSSQYMSDQHSNWTRVSIYLPPGAVSPATRFRWSQHSDSPRGNVWALDNVYLGDGCPWLCSGHGYCKNKKCVCDPGFYGEFCVPKDPLPMMLRDDFSADKYDKQTWREVYGGENSEICGKLVSGKAMTFHKEHIRMAITQDIDTSMLDSIDFYFKYECEDKDRIIWPREESVLLQYSPNGGISWVLLKEIYYNNHQGARYFTIDLPHNAKTNATRFRFWQPKNRGEMQSTWAIDNLFIGRMVSNPSVLVDNFDGGPVSDVWQFINDGKVDSYCDHKTRPETFGSGRSAMVFKGGPNKGENYIITRDMDVGPMSILQYDINVGCGSGSTEKYPVKLEYSSNGGQTWQLLVPNCAEISSARCFDVEQKTTIHYGGTSPYWHRVIIPLDELFTCGSLRFRWYQGFVPENDFAPEWAIDNVFIGMACMDHCLGHGSCDSSMMCTCDPGYAGMACAPRISLPTYLKEDFDQSSPSSDLLLNDSPSLDETKWSLWTGAHIDTHCGNMISGKSLHFNHRGERMLVTVPLDLTNVSVVQFFLRLGCLSLPPEPSNYPVYLQYSINGGINWNSIEQFDFNYDSNRPKYYALHLPEKARTSATVLTWWQPSVDGIFQEGWGIDHVYIGGDIHGVQSLQDDPMVPMETSWLLYPGGKMEQVCDSLGLVLHFNDLDPMRYAVSADVTVEDGTFVQFEIAMGCEPSSQCYSVVIQYSLDMGHSWHLLQQPCLPSDVDCGRFYSGSSLVSDVYTGWNRVTIPLPHYTRSKASRLRWIQPAGYGKSHGWALSNLYIGKDCPSLCTGHGHCTEQGCLCDNGWLGPECSVPENPLPSYLYDEFSSEVDHNKWLKVIGGSIKEPCMVMPAGKALHFDGKCSREIISKDLDLSKAAFIQFFFMFGCHRPPRSRDQGVLVDFSSDGGSTWTPLEELYYGLYHSPKFVHILLPPGAKKKVVRVRLWQPRHSGVQDGDWLIDNIRIGGSSVNSNSLSERFTNPFSYFDWLAADNVNTQDYCNSSNVAKGSTLTGEDSTLISRDIHIEEDYMLQFEVNVGCGQEWNVSTPPVHLQFSTDYGLSWNYLEHQCLPDKPRCSEGPRMASLYFSEPMGMWQRFTYKLNGLSSSSYTRFKWSQRANGQDGSAHMWGLRNIYIGPACDNYCRGRGVCRYPRCVCDDGFADNTCSYRYAQFPTFLKENFEDLPLDKSKWSLIQGGHLGNGCHTMSEDVAMVMAGPSNRQIVTSDLDLRNSEFVQFQVVIGGHDYLGGCATPSSPSHSVILQYSNDAGLNWQTLHVIDYVGHEKPRKEYIVLPTDARSGSARLRWWQPLSDNGQQNGPFWSIDNVFIGGSEINPSELQISFDEESFQADEPWEFKLYGEVKDSVCEEDSNTVSWPKGNGVRSFTTNQLIVQNNFMLHFKIVIGCEKPLNVCTPLAPVRLLFNKNPAVDHWTYVQPLCLPDQNNILDCSPSHYHAASQYSADAHSQWTLVVIELPEVTFSSSTRFRWVQDASNTTGPNWALDDIYVGEKCPEMCNGRGLCSFGTCSCYSGYFGRGCEHARKLLIRKMLDSFEGGIFDFYWESVRGGGIGFGCGSLLPFAHGKTLYFNQCGLREARTVEMDLTRAGKIMFVLQIGCQEQTPSCNINTGTSNRYKGILLQYTKNKGSDWKMIARHDPEDYLRAKKLLYNLPPEARSSGVQFRWWQPVHDGQGYDQWAIDQVEVIEDYTFNMRRRSRRFSGIGS